MGHTTCSPVQKAAAGNGLLLVCSMVKKLKPSELNYLLLVQPIESLAPHSASVCNNIQLHGRNKDKWQNALIYLGINA
jgi:hypothetical protein